MPVTNPVQAERLRLQAQRRGAGRVAPQPEYAAALSAPAIAFTLLPLRTLAPLGVIAGECAE